MGNELIAFALLGMGVAVAFVFFVIGRVVELFRPTLLGIYEQGLLVRPRGSAYSRRVASRQPLPAGAGRGRRAAAGEGPSPAQRSNLPLTPTLSPFHGERGTPRG
jgi:hypothetical protein